MSDDSDSFIREVTEEVRQDRMFRLWKRYGPFVIGAIAAIVLASAGWTWLQHQERQEAQALGGRFLAGDGRLETREALVEETGGEAAVVAMMQLAAAQAEAGETGLALQTYARVAEMETASPAYSGLAALMAARLGAETATAEEIEARLDPLVAPDAPYRLLALELRAAVRLNAGDRDGARADLEAILSSADLTQGLNMRAQRLMTVIGDPDVPAELGGPGDGERDGEPGEGGGSDEG